MSRRSSIYWLLASLAFPGCQGWIPNEPSLASRTGASPVNSDCSSCHAYPVGGVNHQFHLLHADSLKLGNGPITCLDCHRTSLREKDVTLYDSVFADSHGQSASAYDAGTRSSFRDSIARGAYLLARVDTLIHHRPIPVPLDTLRVTFLQEWMTGMDHLNGVLDIRFDAANSDTARYRGRSAVYDPTLETCSAVACHKHDDPYRWPAPSKGLGGLNVDNSLK